MAEWLYEDGIGERRAALVEDGEIIEARIERDGEGPRVGAVVSHVHVAADETRLALGKAGFLVIADLRVFRDAAGVAQDRGEAGLFKDLRGELVAQIHDHRPAAALFSYTAPGAG